MNIIHGEVWKDIPAYESSYQCSDMGRVRSLDRHYLNSLGDKRYHAGILLHQNTDTNGYKQVGLHKQGKSKTFRVHVLVMTCFVCERQNKNVINHKDCNKANNSLSNLEYCSQLQNVIHAEANGLMRHVGVKGEDQYSSKLLDWQVLEIRHLYKQGTYQKLIAAKFGVSKSLVGAITRGEAWRHL